MYWDSFRFGARDLGVRYMMAPSRTRSELVSRRLLNCDLIGGKPSKPAHLLTHFHIFYNITIVLSMRRYPADSKSADLRVLGFRLPLPAPSRYKRCLGQPACESMYTLTFLRT